MAYTHQIYLASTSGGKGLLLAQFRSVGTYPWSPNDNDEFTVPLTETQGSQNVDGYATALWATPEIAAEFQSVIDGMPQGLRNNLQYSIHLIEGRPNFDDWLASFPTPMYRVLNG